MSRQALGLARRLQVNDHAVSFNAGVERRRAIRELGVEAEHVTVVLDAAEHVVHDEHGGGAAERDRRECVTASLLSTGSERPGERAGIRSAKVLRSMNRQLSSDYQRARYDEAPSDTSSHHSLSLQIRRMFS